MKVTRFFHVCVENIRSGHRCFTPSRSAQRERRIHLKKSHSHVTSVQTCVWNTLYGIGTITKNNIGTVYFLKMQTKDFCYWLRHSPVYYPFQFLRGYRMKDDRLFFVYKILREQTKWVGSRKLVSDFLLRLNIINENPKTKHLHL